MSITHGIAADSILELLQGSQGMAWSKVLAFPEVMRGISIAGGVLDLLSILPFAATKGYEFILHLIFHDGLEHYFLVRLQ